MTSHADFPTGKPNLYPNGILLVPTELVPPPAGVDDEEILTLLESYIREGTAALGPTVPAIVRLPLALMPRAALGPAVLSGEACVRCGATQGEMIPCGTGPTGAIFVHEPLCGSSTWGPVDQFEFYRRYFFEYFELRGQTGREVIRLASEGRFLKLLEVVGGGLNAEDAASIDTLSLYNIAVREAKLAETVKDLLAAAREIDERLPEDFGNEALKVAIQAADEALAEEPREIAIPSGAVDAGGFSRYRVVYEVSVPNSIPAAEHVSLAVGITAVPDFLPDRVYRKVDGEWVEVSLSK